MGNGQVSPQRTLSGRRTAVGRRCAGKTVPVGRAECLDQLALAFRDIADRDDIHQAAARLQSVLRWICDESARAAADPIFRDLFPV